MRYNGGVRTKKKSLFCQRAKTGDDGEKRHALEAQLARANQWRRYYLHRSDLNYWQETRGHIVKKQFTTAKSPYFNSFMWPPNPSEALVSSPQLPPVCCSSCILRVWSMAQDDALELITLLCNYLCCKTVLYPKGLTLPTQLCFHCNGPEDLWSVPPFEH